MKTPFNRYPVGTPQGAWLVMFLSAVYGALVLVRIFFDMVRGKYFSLPQTKKHRPKPLILDSDKYGVHKTIQVNNVKLHYVSAGNENSQMMLFLHGFPECWYSWRYQIEAFRNDYHTVAVNMRGYGESDKPQGIYEYTTDKLTEDIVELIQALSPNSKCILVSHDWGGALGWLLVHNHPELFEKFIVLNAPYPKLLWKRLSFDWNQFFASWYMFFFQLPSLPERRFQSGDFQLIDVLFGKYSTSADDVEVYKYYFSNGPNSISGPLNYYRAALKQAVQKRKKPEKDLITLPTLIVWATGDKSLMKELAEDSLTQCPNARLEYIPDCSHWLQLEQPQKVNDIIKDFLKN